MYDDLAAYFHENIVSSYVSYRSIRKNKKYGLSKDLRAAVVAATGLYHLREHVPKSHRKTRNAIAKECPDYDVLGDVVNAAKHKELNQGKPRIKSAKDMYEQIILTEFEDEEGHYTHADKLVKIRFIDGTERDLFECLTKVMNYWGREFVQMGLIDSYKPFNHDPAPGNCHIQREDAENIDLEVLRGVRFNQNILFQKFDPDKGVAVPVDLSGSSLNFRVYKPSYTINLQVTHPSTKKEYNISLGLTEKESMEFHKVETQEGCNIFIKQLAKVRQNEIQIKLLELLNDEGQSSNKEN